MTDQTRVLAIAGSLRDGSYTRLALRAALSAAERTGAETELIDLRELDLPVYDADADDVVDAERLRAAVGNADAILLGTPVYHGSYSAPLKNALDYCGFEEFEDKTVGLLCVAGGRFPVTALDHLRSVCRALNAWVIPHQAAIPKARTAFEDGELVDPDVAERVETLGREAVQYASIEPDPATLESGENVGAQADGH